MPNAWQTDLLHPATENRAVKISADGRVISGYVRRLAATGRSNILNQSNPTEGSAPLRPPRRFRTDFQPFSDSSTVPNMGEKSEAFMRTRYLGVIAFWILIQPGSAFAYPHCDDMGFALVHGQWVSSQWCQEELAAKVSGKRRWGYTTAELHRSPAAMEEFCRGNADIRFTTACAAYKP